MSTIDSDDLGNEALRKIGRNIVNLQKLEDALKTLIVRSNMCGYVSEFAETYRKRVKDVGRRPMGWLVNDFINSVYSDAQLTSDEPDDLSKAWLSFSFRIEADKETVKSRKAALSHLAAERNVLIHRMLHKFDAGSIESCRDLILVLDVQHERLAPQYASVMQMLGELNRVQQEIAAALEAALLSADKNGGNAA